MEHELVQIALEGRFNVVREAPLGDALESMRSAESRGRLGGEDSGDEREEADDDRMPDAERAKLYVCWEPRKPRPGRH